MQMEQRIHELMLSLDQRVTTINRIKQQNDVYRILCELDTFFLKTYTKPWYGADSAKVGFNAHHEAVAWAILAKYALPAPAVLSVATTSDSPLQQPYILTRQLSGQSLTELLTRADRRQQMKLLACVGKYMRQLHDITFPVAGYLTTLDGPERPPDPDGWQHRCWSASQRQTDTLIQLAHDAPELSPQTFAEMSNQCSTIATYLSSAYHPPRYTHGDCHAHQFFLIEEPQQWAVTGVLDMEVTSAGDPDEDVLKFSIEVAQLLPAATRWWESFFEGYGAALDFTAFRLRLLGVASIEFGPPGHWVAINQRERILQHFLRATNWETLFAPISPV